MWAYLTKIRSSQPQRLLLPVVTPNSLPLDCKRSPVSWTNKTIGVQLEMSEEKDPLPVQNQPWVLKYFGRKCLILASHEPFNKAKFSSNGSFLLTYAEIAQIGSSYYEQLLEVYPWDCNLAHVLLNIITVEVTVYSVVDDWGVFAVWIHVGSTDVILN